MRSLVALLAVAVALGLASPGRAGVTLNTGQKQVEITVRLSDRLSSQDSRTGQRFAFETTRPVTLGDLTLPAGTKGHGIVRLAQAAIGPHAGVLIIEAQSLDLTDGRTIPVAFSGIVAPSADDEHTPVVGVGRNDLTFGGGAAPSPNVVYERGVSLTVVLVPSASPAPASPSPAST